MIYRKAEKQDAAALLDFTKFVGGETDFLLMDAGGIGLSVQEEEAMLEQMAHSDKGAMWVALDGSEIVAVTQCSAAGRRPRVAHRASIAVSVKKSHWRKGIASHMMQMMIDWAKQKGFEKMELEVNAENTAAIALYHKFGFAEFGRYPQFFKFEDGRYGDALYMIKELKESVM